MPPEVGGGGGGLQCILLALILCPRFCCCVSLQKRNNRIKLTHCDDTKKRAPDSQIVRAKEKLKLSYGGPSQRQESGTNNRVKALRQVRH